MLINEVSVVEKEPLYIKTTNHTTDYPLNIEGIFGDSEDLDHSGYDYTGILLSIKALYTIPASTKQHVFTTTALKIDGDSNACHSLVEFQGITGPLNGGDVRKFLNIHSEVNKTSPTIKDFWLFPSPLSARENTGGVEFLKSTLDDTDLAKMYNEIVLATNSAKSYIYSGRSAGTLVARRLAEHNRSNTALLLLNEEPKKATVLDSAKNFLLSQTLTSNHLDLRREQEQEHVRHSGEISDKLAIPTLPSRRKSGAGLEKYNTLRALTRGYGGLEIPRIISSSAILAPSDLNTLRLNSPWSIVSDKVVSEDTRQNLLLDLNRAKTPQERKEVGMVWELTVNKLLLEKGFTNTSLYQVIPDLGRIGHQITWLLPPECLLEISNRITSHLV